MDTTNHSKPSRFRFSTVVGVLAMCGSLTAMGLVLFSDVASATPGPVLADQVIRGAFPAVTKTIVKMEAPKRLKRPVDFGQFDGY